MELKWLFKRVRAMSLTELVHRSFKQLGFTCMRLFSEPIHVCEMVGLHFGFEFSTHFPGSVRERIILKADQVLAGQFEFFGKIFTLDAVQRWHMDPFSRKDWPLVYFLDIDYRKADAPGDPKIIWEINRHQYLVLAALAHSWTGRTEYRDFVVSEILGWIRANPPLRGINWVSSMEVGIRLLSWVAALSVLGRDRIGNDAQETIARGMYVQTRFIFMNLSRHSSANNHLIGELTGALAAALFLDCRAAGKMADKAVKFLQQQLNRQFHPDGVCSEQAINYQCHTMDYYMVAENLCRRMGRSLGQEVLDRISAGLSFLLDLGGDEGTCPNLGDEDDGFVAPVLGEAGRVESTIALAATLSGLSPGIVPLFKDSRSIFFHPVSVMQNDTIGSVSVPGALMDWYPMKDDNLWHIYPQGGYAVRRCHTPGLCSNLLLDFGPIGQAPLRAHGHADLLSICVSVNGKPFIADPGTFLYYGDEEWRQYFRSTASHSTACVGNHNQLQSLGRFQWGRDPRVHWENPDPLTIRASHDGYLRQYGVFHERTVLQEGQTIRVSDRFISLRKGNKISYRIKLHLHPDVKVERLEENRFHLVNEGERLDILFKKDANVHVHEGGGVNPIDGWYSRRFYQKEPSAVIFIDGYVETDPEQEVSMIVQGKVHALPL
jgi:hypothetical protein